MKCYILNAKTKFKDEQNKDTNYFKNIFKIVNTYMSLKFEHIK